jgi:signal peptidase I
MNTDDLWDRDTLRLALNGVVILLLVAVVAPFVVYAVPGVVGADHGLVVLSGSMEPAMSPGDAVIVSEAPPSEIETGDVITFQTNSETPTTHRVVEVRQTENGVAYVTKGDANEDPDRGSVPHDRVIGEVIFVIPFIGHVIRFANTQVGFFALVLTPMVLFVLSELWELAKSIREPSSASADGSTDGEVTTATAVPDSDSAPDSADDETDEAGFTLTRSSLQLLLLVFGFYLAYSGYVAYTTREAWSIAVAVATIIAFLFCLVIYFASRGVDSGQSTGGSGRSIEGVVRRGELPARLGERTTVPLESVESLVQMALDRDDWVIYDEEQDTYYMARDDALYLHQAAPETDGGTAIDTADDADAEATESEATEAADPASESTGDGPSADGDAT